MRRSKEVFSAKTGTGASTEISRRQLRIQYATHPVMAKITLTYGTTITIQLQGQKHGSTNWELIEEATYTSGTPKYLKDLDVASKRYHQYRLEITANTGCTVNKAYIGIGTVEN